MNDYTYAKILKQLSDYDIITFDIFDTLIARCVVKPVDVFAIVEAKAKKENIIDRDFFRERQAAEQAGYSLYGESNNLPSIYALLAKRYQYTQEQCKYLAETEIATELEVVVPRCSMLMLVQELIRQGKRILFCSDMYLDAETIRKLLTKCGYPADIEIWVSNEKAASKHTGEIWKQLFAYLPQNKKTIHLGDNEWADYRSLKQIGREAIWINSGINAFKTSPLADYLSAYLTNDIGNSLFMGYLINKACFNSPFSGESTGEDVVAAWMGPVFACFMDWLVQQNDGSLLLFVTREGYLLKPLYERYCSALGMEPQKNTIFYASRAATLSATVTSNNDIKDIMLFAYEGTLGHFVKSRMNYDIPADSPAYNMEICLPQQWKKAMQALQPYRADMIANGKLQNEAYREYIRQKRSNAPGKMTVVDVGYTGTIQYALSKILSENVGGQYMYLNEKHVYEKAGCSANCLRKSTVGIRPVFHNLLFLEAAMQAPYGQLQKMVSENGHVKPVFNQDASISEYISVAQEYFSQFAEWIGTWKRALGEALALNFELAEAIWICLLKFNYLPQQLLDSFWLADDFAGHPMWKYDSSSQTWVGKYHCAELSFVLPRSDEKISQKQKIKEWVKTIIPNWAYAPAQKIWTRFIR